MNYLIGFAVLLLGAGAIVYLTGFGILSIGSIIVSEDELIAASAIVTLRNAPYKGDVEAFLVDTPNGNILPEARAYAKRYPGMTWAEKNMKEGIALAVRMKAVGQKIEMPELKVREGYHITRWNGSASLVKDGEPEPIFGKTFPNGTTVWSDGRVEQR